MHSERASGLTRKTKGRLSLGKFLELLHARYHRSEFLSSDPLEFVHRFRNPLEQEAAGLICALLAYGNVKTIRASSWALLEHLQLQGSLEDAIRQKRALPEKWKHRFNGVRDLQLLLELLSESWDEHGALGGKLGALRLMSDPFESSLNALIQEWKQKARERGAADSFFHLLNAPKDGSCCKRWCMYFRWMVRKDALDLGTWQAHGFVPADLRFPLDTHTQRISQYLGLTSRKNANWRSVVEVTDALREVSPLDPVKYDFSLARLGILSVCQRKYRAEICEQCELRPACSFANRSNPM